MQILPTGHTLQLMFDLSFEYAPSLVPEAEWLESGLTVFVSGSLVLVPPDSNDPWLGGEHPFAETHAVALGRLGGKPLRCAALDEVPVGWQTWSLRDYLVNSSPLQFRIAGLGMQLMNWLRQQNFCPQCGRPLAFISSDRALHCNFCQYRDYPRINPCVIVAVGDGKRVLLAQSHRLRSRGIYSCLAGFVEAGESLEEAVHREVAEEAGIEIGRLVYQGSQSWPFPHQLMLGFTASHVAGELNPDRDELADLGWFAPQSLPLLPPPQTIARTLIDRVLESLS